MMRHIASILWIFILCSTSFGYSRLLTFDASPAPLFRADNTAIQFLLNPNVAAGIVSSASGKTVISSGSDPQTAVRAALAAWNGTNSANIKFLPLKPTSLGIDLNDSKMVIAVGASPAELSVVGGALAITTVNFSPFDQSIGGMSLPKGVITDSDIIVNPAYIFSTDGSTLFDLQSVITHELGHSLGANHTGLMGAVMFQTNAGQRFLTTDDVAFAGAAYTLSSAAPSGTISGAITLAGGLPAPFALLTAFDTSTGVTVGGLANADGTYSIQCPPGNYQIYAEPLNGAIPINVYLNSDQAALAAATKFQTTLYSGSLSVAANSTVLANIAVIRGASSLATPLVTVSAVNANPASAYVGGPATVPSGQSVDLILAGAGFDSTLNDSNFAIYGQGIVVHAGSVRVDSRISYTINGISYHLLRVTLDVTARVNPSLASFVVTSGANSLSFSGALVIVPPAPAFVSAGVVSAAPYTGIPSGVSPGGIYSIYDIPNTPNLGPAIYILNGPYDAYGGLATNLGGVSVTFDGVPSPMFLSSGGQLNFQVPFEVAGKTSTKVVVDYLGSSSAAITVPVLPVQPGFFTSDGKAVRAYNLADHTINSPQNPAAAGSYVEVYGTGVGKVAYAVPTGQGAPVPPAGFTGNYTYSVGGSPASAALFGGWTPTAAGLAQWDLQIPANTPRGAVSIVVTDTATGSSSQPGATIFVQ